VKPTKELPPEYQVVFTLDLSRNLLVSIILNIVAVFVFVLAGFLFARASMLLRPDFWADDLADLYSSKEIVNMLIALVLMLIIHEAVHGLAFWFITRERPKFGFTGIYAYTAAPEWYIPRNPMVVSALAPLVLLTVLGIVLMPIMPSVALSGLVFFLSLNTAGSVGDIFLVFWIITRTPTALVNDHGDRFTIYGSKMDL
jgi:hypothetical protein